MPLLRFDTVSLAFGHVPLLAHVDFQIEQGERVCLLGRNGAGKTTLLRAITGAALPDEGEIWRHDTLRIAHLEQEVPPDTEQTVYEVVAVGLGELGALLAEYHQATHEAGRERNDRPCSAWRSCKRASMRWVAGTSIRKWRPS